MRQAEKIGENRRKRRHEDMRRQARHKEKRHRETKIATETLVSNRQNKTRTEEN